MYSLPIAPYKDYWRLAKNRSLTVGGTLVLAGTTLVYTPADPILEFPNQLIPRVEPNLESFIQGNTEPVISEEEQEFLAASSQSTLPELNGNVVVNYRIEDVEIPIETEVVESNQIAPGMSKVQEAGVKGTERRVIRTTQVGGEISDEQIIHQFVLDAPKKRVVLQNTQPVPVRAKAAGVDLSQLDVVNSFTVEATAYTYTGNRTATGVYPAEGMIAVDPRVIPLGTKVYVEGYGYAIAADTGGAIKGKIIDVFFPNLRTCLEWGRRSVKIHILSGN